MTFFAPTKQISQSIKKSTPWVEKYRPQSLDDVVHQEEVVRTLAKSLETGNLPHLLFYGPPGTGKTTTINAIARQLYGPEQYKHRMLELNASDERGISVVRDKVKAFAQLTASSKPPGSKYPFPPYKLVVLDEADSMTVDAQAALRRIMENFSKATRFCLICNYVSRIIEPLASRCAKFRFRSLEANALEQRLVHVAKQEGFECDEATLTALRQVSGGDMRKAITFLQSTRMLYGDELNAAAVIELAGVVPHERIDGLLRLTRNEPDALAVACGVSADTEFDLDVGALAAVRVACRSIVSDGYAAKRVVAQFADALLACEDIDELCQARALELAAAADHSLLSGADEYLQLLNLVGGTHALMGKAAKKTAAMATD